MRAETVRALTDLTGEGGSRPEMLRDEPERKTTETQRRCGRDPAEVTYGEIRI